MLDDWRINWELKDLPPEVWAFLRNHKYFAMIIPKKYGGLEFSAYAHSQLIRKIASRSITAAVTVMVPNSLGPGELLLQFGTKAQQDYWLPRLAVGKEIPCFGLTDPIVDMSMGQTAEKLAYLFDISREEADQYAVTSHMRLHRAQEEGFLDHEVEPAFSHDGKVWDRDDGVRQDSSVEQLARLPPAFEPYGRVTAGNSSQVTDGVSWVILASEEAVEKYGLKPKAVIRDSAWAALDPSIMGLGPALASTELLARHNLAFDRIEVWEINEAFAAQILACLRAWNDEAFCRDVLGLDGTMGALEHDKLNVDGGAISLGHPVGTSGNRIVLHLVNVMHRLDKKRGIATECIGGGQGGAMLLERV